jgi:hypothetical protein
MKLSEFIVLDEQAKKSAVLHDAILLAKKREKDSIVFLFQLDGYYVEAYGDYEKKQVHTYTAFNNINLLQPWLESIPIPDLPH